MRLSTCTFSVFADISCPTRPQYLHRKRGIIRSHPSSGLKEFADALDCKWIILGRPGEVVHLRFEYLHLPANCSVGNLTVFNGGDVHSREIATVCGSKLPVSISSTGENVRLRLKTERKQGFKGFTLHYTILRGESG